MTSTVQAASVLAIARMRPLSGFAHGLRSPSLLVTLVRGREVGRDRLLRMGRALDAALLAEGVSAPEEPGFERAGNVVESLLYWIERIQDAAGLPVMESGRVVSGKAGRRVRLAVPTAAGVHQPIAGLVGWLVALCNQAGAGGAIDKWVAELPKVLSELKPWSARGSNVPRLLRAARRLGIQTQAVTGQIIQLGQGRHTRWLESSFTDVTPHISVVLSQHKFVTAAVLRKAGIPVPRHELVDSEDAALAIAGKLGYPVVVKPARLEGGAGVAAGLRNADEVRAAYAAARKLSDEILVEQHVAGRDYRLTVLHGKLFWAVERVPAGVTGDGVSAVRTLVEQANLDPRRGQGRHAAMKRLVLDEEALATLAAAGRSADTVPEPGEFVPLRRKANVAAGGTPVAVMDLVHPDNARLAVRAAAALRLDLAGIDLLIPDIGRSWKESGAGICEVNAQPQLGGVTSLHVYPQLLEALVRGTGRIPIVLILGAAENCSLGGALSATLAERGLSVGLADRDGVRIAGERIVDGPVPGHEAGQILMGDRTVDAAILCINDASLWSHGLPFDRFDVLVLAGTRIDVPSNFTRLSAEDLLGKMLAMILPACDGTVLALEGAGVTTAGLEQRTPAHWDPQGVSQQLMPARVIEALESAIDR